MFFLREKYIQDDETKSSQAADLLCLCSVFKLDLLQVCRLVSVPSASAVCLLYV